jgi:hypothetical protein
LQVERDVRRRVVWSSAAGHPGSHKATILGSRYLARLLRGGSNVETTEMERAQGCPPICEPTYAADLHCRTTSHACELAFAQKITSSAIDSAKSDDSYSDGVEQRISGSIQPFSDADESRSVDDGSLVDAARWPTGGSSLQLPAACPLSPPCGGYRQETGISSLIEDAYLGTAPRGDIVGSNELASVELVCGTVARQLTNILGSAYHEPVRSYAQK